MHALRRFPRTFVPSSSARGGDVVRHALLLFALAACAPRVGPLAGVPTTVPLPATALPPGHERLIFRWEYGDRFFSARGEGVARIAPPDSVRLDFFADGGLGNGFALLLGDTLLTPAEDDARRYLPPVPMLWAALGRLQVAASDTVLHQQGDTLWAQFAGEPTWRAAFVGRELHSLARVDGRRLRETIRRDSSVIAYRNPGARRRLTLTLTRRVQDPPYDAAIWRR